MEKITSQRGRSPKRANKLKKERAPMKVVYISDPVKVTARPAEFRALVQQLTGRDSDITVDLACRFDPMVGKAAACSPATECNAIFSPPAAAVGVIVSPYDAFDEDLERAQIINELHLHGYDLWNVAAK